MSLSPEKVELAVKAAAAATVGGLVLMAVIARRPARGLYMYLFLCGFLLTPKLPVVREKLCAADAVLVGTLAVLALTWHRRRRPPVPLLRSQTAVLQAAALFVLVAGASLVINTLGHRQDVQRGVIEVATYILGLLAMGAIVLEIDTWAKWRRAVAAWGAGAAAVTAVGLVSMFVYSPAWTRDAYSGRISATMKTSLQLASYVAPVVPAAALLLERRRGGWPSRVLSAGLVLGAFAVLIGTGSRSAFLITVAAAAGTVLLLHADARQRRTTSRMAELMAVGGVVGAVLLVVLAATDPGTHYVGGSTPPHLRAVRLFTDLAKGRGMGDEDRRLPATTRPLAGLAEAPAFGVGPSNFGVYHGQEEVHNSFLTALGETGLFGFAALMAFFACTAHAAVKAGWMLRRHPERMLTTAFLLGFGLLMLYQMTVNGLRQRPLWFVCGLTACLPRIAVELESRRRAARLAALDPANNGPANSGPANAAPTAPARSAGPRIGGPRRRTRAR